MLTVDLSRAPLSAGEIRAERDSLETQERSYFVMLGLAVIALAALCWAFIAPGSPAPTVSAVGMAAALVAACRVGAYLLTLAAKFAALQPANPIELLQVPTLVQQSARCAAYVARVAASERELLGIEFTALVREADRAVRAAARVDMLANAFYEVSTR